MDSGVGGLSVLREIHRQLPEHPTLYVADQAHLPYGPRDPLEVRGFVEQITRYLLGQGAEVIVIPCHTACAAGLHELRAQFPHLPIVGLEPAVKPAALATQSGVISVLTTEATAKSAMYHRLLDRFARQIRVITQPAPELVLLAERGVPDAPESAALVAQAVQPLLDAGADQIVLACTHFPFIAPLIRALAGDRAALVDPSAAVARQVARVVSAWQPTQQQAGMDSLDPGRPLRRYVTTGDAAAYALTGIEVTPDTVSLV
jgi:glutamate racemase